MNETHQQDNTQDCPLTCPNRVHESKILGKGYSIFTSLLLTFFLSLNAFDFSTEYDGRLRVSVNTRPVPMETFVPSALIILSILGMDTDKLAFYLGKLTTKPNSEE